MISLFEIYNTLIYAPLFNLMVFFYNVIPGHDIGVAIIVLTLFVRLVLYPVNGKSIKSQRQMQEIQPEIRKIQERYKDNKEKQAKKLMEFYQKKKINPFSGCLPILIQFPILIALYHVFINGFKDESLSVIYGFVGNPGHINPVSFGFLNLAQSNVYLALIAGGAQYFQTKMMVGIRKEKKATESEKSGASEEKAQDFAQSMTKQMVYFMPVLTFFFAMNFPAGLALYWAVTTIFAIIQQYLIMRKQKISEGKIATI